MSTKKHHNVRYINQQQSEPSSRDATRDTAKNTARAARLCAEIQAANKPAVAREVLLAEELRALFQSAGLLESMAFASVVNSPAIAATVTECLATWLQGTFPHATPTPADHYLTWAEDLLRHVGRKVARHEWGRLYLDLLAVHLVVYALEKTRRTRRTRTALPNAPLLSRSES